MIPQGIDDLFDREDERELLFWMLRRAPARVLVLVGPQSAGKTKLLKELLVEHPKLVGMSRPAVYIDGRMQKISSSADLIAAIKNSGITMLQKLKWSAASSRLWAAFKRFPISFELTAGSSPGLKVKTGSSSPSAESPVKEVLKLLTTVLSKQTSGESSDLPVIVVDEANALAEWRDADGESDLRSLLRYFVNVNAPTSVFGAASA